MFKAVVVTDLQNHRYTDLVNLESDNESDACIEIEEMLDNMVFSKNGESLVSVELLEVITAKNLGISAWKK